MGIKNLYTCDISGRTTTDPDDVVIYDVTRGDDTTRTVVMTDIVTAALEEDNEELLGQVTFRDD